MYTTEDDFYIYVRGYQDPLDISDIYFAAIELGFVETCESYKGVCDQLNNLNDEMFYKAVNKAFGCEEDNNNDSD